MAGHVDVHAAISETVGQLTVMLCVHPDTALAVARQLEDAPPVRGVRLVEQTSVPPGALLVVPIGGAMLYEPAT